ncbi:HypC/HybG/HupF family hydrogenase formation chaperone [Subtercola sp. PAMC28395]|uniref:HypC/HybG/HupF family hydrogenase formation chaperone n=1 Tax=Subtercola sp. PAMC28395 TaxID=2846775 RepID=UPI001C0C33B6|nr:HypC/HybG/HupF family hydrogenase formation chaperone [Subtercola sp. PAMC28395]QWT23117.1 HypC/HybG/HupF family hydrogenase formation chaperone [Subtercola sp. PAMC28395]
MCLGIPGEIVEIVDADDCLAKVDVSGVKRTISIRLLADEGIEVGDWVLVHVGFAMSKIDEAEAQMTLDQIKKLGQTYDEELIAFMETEIV